MLQASSTNKAVIAARSLVEDYFRQMPCPVTYMGISAEVQAPELFVTEEAAPGGPATALVDQPPSAALLAGAALRGLRASAVLRELWGAAPFLGLLSQPQAAVRWIATQALALLFNLVRIRLPLAVYGRNERHLKQNPSLYMQCRARLHSAGAS